MVKRALILGRGKSGLAAAEQLRLAGYETTFAEGYDCVVTSPGLVVKSELQLGCELLRARGVKLLAVTGSKGKSSVVKLVAEALTRSGHPAVACGNYGLPVTAVPSCGWAVVEVSSFQLETTSLADDTFEAAALLNLQADHLDRHGSLALYHTLKRRLLTMTRHSVDMSAYPTRRALRATALFETALSALKGSYFDNEILAPNGVAAVNLLRVAGLTDDAIRAAFRAFEPLPHRMNELGVWGGMRCIDDSKATSLSALGAALEMCGDFEAVGGRIRLIAGGLAKGDDPNSVKECLTKWVKKVYLIGCSASGFESAWSSAVKCELCGTMARAVECAYQEAEKGDILLLSPGTASFDQFKSFGERGDVFAQLVQSKGKS